MITPQKGIVIAGRCALVSRLNGGGMGSIWRACHRELEVDVAVKFMHPSLLAFADARTRFEREARVAARLDSQHVVKILDYGVDDDTPYIVMELLSGKSLFTRLARQDRLPLPVATRLLVQICKALRTVHHEGLVHRDLKPGNVFLALKDQEEVVKILDFGIAKTADLDAPPAHTVVGEMIGSVDYMSPEQIRDARSVDQRSDLWSVGVILYRALAGRLPFPGVNAVSVLARVLNDPRPPPSLVAAELPPGIDDFFARAFARDPDQRFQSAAEMAEAFCAMAQGARAPAVRAGALTNDRAVLEASEPQPGPGSAADAPTLAVPPPLEADLRRAHLHLQPSAIEASSLAIPAVLLGPRVELSPEIDRPPVGNERGTVRSWWPAVVAAAVVAVAAIFAVALGWSTPPRSSASNASASPDVTEAAPGRTAEITASRDAGAPPAVAAAPSGSPRPTSSETPHAILDPRKARPRAGPSQAQPSLQGSVVPPRASSTPGPPAPTVVAPRMKADPLNVPN